jgi:hypothetical protein
MLRAPEHNPEKLQTLRTRTCSKRATTTGDSGGFMVTFAVQARGNVSKRRNSKEAPQPNGLQGAAIDIFATPGKKTREIRSAFLSRGQVGIQDWIPEPTSFLAACRSWVRTSRQNMSAAAAAFAESGHGVQPSAANSDRQQHTSIASSRVRSPATYRCRRRSNTDSPQVAMPAGKDVISRSWHDPGITETRLRCCERNDQC